MREILLVLNLFSNIQKRRIEFEKVKVSA